MRNLLIISKFLSFCSVFCSVNSPTFTLLVQSDTNWESMVIGPPYLPAINTLEVSCLVLSGYPVSRTGRFRSVRRTGWSGNTKDVSIPVLNLQILLFIRKSISIMQYKREFRDLPDETKQKISNSTRGKSKSSTHKEHIRQGMLKYWSGVEWRDRSHENNDVEPLNTDGSM